MAVGGAAVLGLAIAGVAYFLSWPRTQPTSTSAAASISVQDLQITQLTTSGNAALPAASPDGKYVAYIQRDSDSDSLWIRQTAINSNVRILQSEPGERLSGVTVTPDGSFVDVVRGRNGRFALWRMPFLGGTPRRLIADVETTVAWSPDGATFAFVRRNFARGESSLIVADGEGRGERVLALQRDPLPFSSLTNSLGYPPAWSPDGSIIAVAAVGSPGGAAVVQHLVFVDVSTGSVRTLPLPEQISDEAAGLAWLDRDSLVLAVPSGPGSPRQLWRLSFPEGGLSRVTNDLNVYQGVGLTADRTMLVTARTETHRGVWIADAGAANGADAVPLAPRVLDGVAWAADRLLYVTTTNGPPAIVRLVPGGAPEELVSRATNPDVTPDGRTIVFRSTEDLGIWKVSVDGGQRVKVAVGDSPTVTPDGRSVLFRSGALLPWIVSLDGQSPRQFANVAARAQSLAVSPDGTSIAFMSRDDQNDRVIRTCALVACEMPQTLAVPSITGRLRYTPDGRAIAYLDASAANIWLLPRAGGSPRQFTHFTDGLTIGDFAWSRDGKRLAVSRVSVTNDIVLFKGLKR